MRDFLDAELILQAIVGVLTILGIVAFVFALARSARHLVRQARKGAVPYLWQKCRALIDFLPHRKNVWGTVYDATTKRPIAFAKVQLLDMHKRVLETRIADQDGRYGFLTTFKLVGSPQSKIRVAVASRGYTFPSRVSPTIDTLMYSNFYFGQSIDVHNDVLLNFDIPMDPISVVAPSKFFRAPSIALGVLAALFADLGLVVGIIIVPLSFILVPNPFTLGVVFLFLGTVSMRVWGIVEHPFGVVKDTSTGRPLAFALLTLDDREGKRVAFTVSDERGRYFLVIPKGSYVLTATTPASTGPMRTTKSTIDSARGWITREIVV